VSYNFVSMISFPDRINRIVRMEGMMEGMMEGIRR
jgi:hypothetical protein